MRALVVFLLAIGFVSRSIAQSDDHAVRVEKQLLQEGVVRLVITSDHLSESTVVLTATLENMDSSVAMPFILELKGVGSRELCVFKIHDPSQSWHYKYHFEWKYGLRGGHPDPDAVYRLPYQDNEYHVVMQGNRGAFSHQAGSSNEFAYDFAMPIGSTVCAARGGVVIGVRQDSDVGGSDEKFKLSDNYVLVRHSDGTYAEYIHLKKNGALVALGDTVAAGQPIGLSGVTGHTTGPHLHFAVFRLVDKPGGFERQSLPVRVRTKAVVLDELKQGNTY